MLQRDESSDPWHYFVLFFALDCLTQLLFSLLPSSSLYLYVLLFSRAKSLQRQDNIAIKRLKNQWLCSSLCHRHQKKEGKKKRSIREPRKNGSLLCQNQNSLLRIIYYQHSAIFFCYVPVLFFLFRHCPVEFLDSAVVELRKSTIGNFTRFETRFIFL